MTDQAALDDLRTRIDETLSARLSDHEVPDRRLAEAVRYATLNGGKRIRPLLVVCTCTSLGGDLEHALAPACAVEFIHAYSLIHDDLPAMDDDDLRRGRATCHIAFDEATAILAGDALLTLAFETLATAPGLDPTARVESTGILASAAGWRGMVGGQALDVAAAGEMLEESALGEIHAAKTGALIKAAVLLGATAADATAAQREQLGQFGEHLGLAFQVIDDVLDATATTAALGKRAGADAALRKPTYVSLLGPERAMARANTLTEAAYQALRDVGVNDGPLWELTAQLLNRKS
jgi:geranylgeranyl pyrophosphate synthase